MATLAYCGQVKRKAAQILGVSLKTLYNRLETYNGKPSVRSDDEGFAALAGDAPLEVTHDTDPAASGG
jgi:hypothetical protein